MAKTPTLSSVDGKSDLSVVAGGSVYSLDFFPEASHPFVDEKLDIFPPISLLQELKSAHFDDTFRKAFPNPPHEILENMRRLQGCRCRIQYIPKVEELKCYSGEAIDHLKCLYSAFCSSDSDRLFTIDATSEIVLENAVIILCTTADLMDDVEHGHLQIKQLEEAVSQEMDLRSKLDRLQIQYTEAKEEYKDPRKACLEGLKALKADLQRHFNHLIESAVQNDKENAQVKSKGFRAFTKNRRDKKRELDELKRQINVLKDRIKTSEEQSDQGDTQTVEMQDNALTDLLISLEIMDLHLVYAFYFLTQLGNLVRLLDVTCRKFRSIALGDEIISENKWMDFKSTVLASNIGWAAIDRLFDEFVINKPTN